jgi:hypothetical protein
MGTGTTNRRVKAVKLAKCSVCYKIPTPDCNWNQGRCPHHNPMINLAVINNFFNFFKRFK